MRCVILGLAVMVAGAGVAWGDSGPTMMGELQNARVVVVGHGDGRGRVVVEEVMKGVEPRRFIAVEGAGDGGRVVVLERYEERRVWGAADLPERSIERDVGAGVWAVAEGLKPAVSVPDESGAWGGPGKTEVALADLRELVARSAPEAAGLQGEVVDALFFPENAAALKARDADEALYVEVVIGVMQMRRDVDFLAGFLESQEKPVRDGAQAMLERVTGAAVAGPAGEGAVECLAAADRWRAWWREHAGKLAWNEEKGRWEERKGSAGEVRKWPAVPAGEKWSGETSGIPAGLVAAVGGDGGKPDGAALAREVRALVDSGVMRDRVIGEICGVQRAAVKGAAAPALPAWAEELEGKTEAPWARGDPGVTESKVLDWVDGMPEALFGGNGPYMPTAPRLRKDVMLDVRIPAELRARLVVENVVAANVERFRQERKGVFDYVHEKQATAEEVTRAVYWEPKGGILDYALYSFGELGDEASQRRLVTWFVADPTRFIPAIDAGVEAKHAVLVAGLVEELKAGDGAGYEWAARTLTLHKVAEALPVLAGRMGDGDARVREWTAFALCRDSSKETVTAVLAAMGKETDGKARAMELLALEQTDDVRAEGVLLAATKDAAEAGEVQQLCRGLARMKSEKGLGFIAGVALDPPGDSRGTQTQFEAVMAFGYVTGLYPGHAPEPLGQGGAIEPKRVEEALPVIRKWVAAHEGGK